MKYKLLAVIILNDRYWRIINYVKIVKERSSHLANRIYILCISKCGSNKGKC